MKKTLISLTIIAASIGLAIAAPTAKINAAKPAAVKKAKQISLLFVQSAKSAQLVAGKAVGTYKLVLQEPNDQVLYFSDRPNRIAGQMPLAKYLELWNKGVNSFKEDNPNAAVYSATFEGKSAHGVRSDVFALSNPVLGKDVLTYNAKTIGHNHALKLGKYNNVALFVDYAVDTCSMIAPMPPHYNQSSPCSD